jgi:hypothetical protein
VPSNLQNSLKPGGNGIVAIDHLPRRLDSLQTFVGRLVQSVLLLIFLLIFQRDYRESVTVHPGIHSPILLQKQSKLF